MPAAIPDDTDVAQGETGCSHRYNDGPEPRIAQTCPTVAAPAHEDLGQGLEGHLRAKSGDHHRIDCVVQRLGGREKSQCEDRADQSEGNR